MHKYHISPSSQRVKRKQETKDIFNLLNLSQLIVFCFLFAYDSL